MVREEKVIANKLFDIKDRVALVTGAGSGLGRSFACTLARAGAMVALGGRRADRLEETAAMIGEAGGKSEAFVMDVTDAESVSAAFDAVDSAFGTVEVVVNNAGIARSGLLTETSEEDWGAVIDTNLTAVHRVAAEAVRRMQAAETGGSVINIASILGLRVTQGLGGYIAAKSAVIQLTKAQALEWGRLGVRANAIAPGYFETDMNAGFFETPQGEEMVRRIPMRRIGDNPELDGALLLLASDASSYMTGSVVTVDGGHLCSGL